MINFSKEELLAIYDKVKDKVFAEVDPEQYFYLVNNPDKFTLADAISFEIIHRMSQLYTCNGEYTAPQRIGLFANTYLIESCCIGKQINPFNIYGFPIKFGYGDNTHTSIKLGDGTYAPDLLYKGRTGKVITAEVKSFDSAFETIESTIKKYSFKDTKTTFPYNADYLILFDRNTFTYYLVSRNIKFTRIKKGVPPHTDYISDEEARSLPGFTRVTLDSFGSRYDDLIIDEKKIKQDTFIYYKLDFVADCRIHDVKQIRWNEEICSLAAQIASTLGITCLERKVRKNK